MINEEKVKLMLELNKLEKKSNMVKSATYYFNDYVALGMMRTFISTTISFILFFCALVMYKMDYFLTSFTQNTINLWAKEYIVIFGVYSVVFQIIAFFVYAHRYQNNRVDYNLYKRSVKRLEGFYQKEDISEEENNEEGEE